MKLLVQGRVERGEGMATRLGCPTANIAIGEGLVIPALGVYVGETEVAQAWYPTLICVSDGRTGVNLKIEVHLLGEHKELVGKSLSVLFYEKLRDLIPFPGEEAMVQLIAQDMAQARDWFLQQMPEKIL